MQASPQSASAAIWPPFMATPGLSAVLRWASELLDAQLGALIGRADAAQPLRDLQVGSETAAGGACQRSGIFHVSDDGTGRVGCARVHIRRLCETNENQTS